MTQNSDEPTARVHPTLRMGQAVNPAGFRLDELIDPEPWTEHAVCAQVDADMFFPERGGSTREAKQVCRLCTVTSECLEYALRNGERYGVWGGVSERDRRRLAATQQVAS